MALAEQEAFEICGVLASSIDAYVKVCVRMMLVQQLQACGKVLIALLALQNRQGFCGRLPIWPQE